MRSQLHPPPGVTAQLAGLPVLAAQANAALSSSEPPPADATRRAGRGGAGAACGLPPAAAGARAADPDRARDGLVGADRVRDRDPAQPDVGDAGRARDRDLDRVQRAALRTFPPGARGRLRPADGAGADVPVDGRWRCSRRGSPRSPASACSCSPNITMLRDFGFVTLIDLSVSLGGVLLVLPAALAISERQDLRGRRGRPVPPPGGAAAAASSARPSGVSERPPDAPEEPKPTGSTPTGRQPRLGRPSEQRPARADAGTPARRAQAGHRHPAV